MNYTGRSIKRKDKVGIILECHSVDNDASQYTHIFRVMYPDKSKEILIYPFSDHDAQGAEFI